MSFYDVAESDTVIVISTYAGGLQDISLTLSAEGKMLHEEFPHIFIRKLPDSITQHKSV